MSEYLYTSPAFDRSVEVRRRVMKSAMSIFGAWGYGEIQVPLIHYFDALRPGLQEEMIEQSFRFVDRSGNLMILRPDVTPVIAQTVARARRRESPLRLSYTHKVVRLERAFAREQLESYQIGVERIGGDPFVADLETLLIAHEALGAFGLERFEIAVCDHALVRHLLHSSGAPRRARERLRRALVARDRDALDQILARLGTREAYARSLRAMASLRGGQDTLLVVADAFPDDPFVRERVERLGRLQRALFELGVAGTIRLELANLVGAGYYTGLGFEIVAERAGRALGYGGRYDEMIKRYGHAEGGVGFSLSLDTVIEALGDRTQRGPAAASSPPPIEVEPRDPTPGFARALEARRRGQQVRVVGERGGRDA